MKKTLLITLDFMPAVGGVATYWRNLSEHMDASQWVVLAPTQKAPHQDPGANYNIRRRKLLKSYISPAWLPLFWHAYKTIKEEKIEHIIVGQILPVGTVVYFLTRLLNVPYTVSTHGMDVTFAMKHPRKRKMAQKILAKAEQVITVSGYTASKLQELGVPKEKIHFIRPCPGIEVRPIKTQKAARPTVITVARLVKRKGHSDMLKAIADIKKNIPNISYIIVGDGPERVHIEKEIHDLGLSDNVTLAGEVQEQEKQEYLARSHVFAMTPYDNTGDVEGFGIVYLEAGSYSLPVVATRSGGIPDAVQDGKTGMVVQERDIPAIAHAIEKLLKEPAYAQKLGTQGKERVQKEFQWQKQAQKLQELLV